MKCGGRVHLIARPPRPFKDKNVVMRPKTRPQLPRQTRLGQSGRDEAKEGSLIKTGNG